MEDSYTDLISSIKLVDFLEAFGAPNIGLSIKNLMMLLSTSSKEVKQSACEFFHKLIRNTVTSVNPAKSLKIFLSYFTDMNEYHKHQLENIIMELD